MGGRRVPQALCAPLPWCTSRVYPCVPPPGSAAGEGDDSVVLGVSDAGEGRGEGAPEAVEAIGEDAALHRALVLHA